jgi:hypothetical protein
LLQEVENFWFRFFKAICDVHLSSYVLKNGGAYKNHSRYQLFSKDINLVLKLDGSQQFENSQFFLAGFSQAGSGFFQEFFYY